ncbi:hypothetical protein SAMN05443428_1411 [Caloramator quimbayensis]|uniref:Uncharacterized protein n=1 Tax=Caloramator quimbayensis TaxID=1147123 RepID=A0A1T4YEB3_9CLOT|nr:hypothetical protein [Caloramator quimbayensis]SKB00030.1 hypothetical protein SAMN05443428_1411 [Caloramator quimbayensis]
MKQLEKRAKEVILKQMEDLAEITTEQVMELIKPHFCPDYQKLAEQALRRQANNLIARYRDDKGVRKYFNYKDPWGTSKYVNVDKTDDVYALSAIEINLEKKLLGLSTSVKKIKKHKQEIIGQLSIENLISMAE